MNPKEFTYQEKPKTPRAKKTPPKMSELREQPSSEQVAELAYYKAEKRGFTPGSELDDWLEAENEINTPDNELDDWLETESEELDVQR